MLFDIHINKKIRPLRLCAVAACAALAWLFLEPQSGLSPRAFHMAIIFIASMAGIMLEVCSTVAFLFMTMLVANLTGTIDVLDGFSGFHCIVPWLLFFILSLAKVVTKTTLGLRLAYFFMKHFGGGLVGLSYSMILTELFVAPILPSNTARSASVGLPLVTSLSKYISSHIKGVSETSIGGYLTLLYAYSNAVCSAMFITAMISNAIIIEEMGKIGINITWLAWMRFMILPCGILLLLLPFIVRVISNPRVKKLDGLREQAMKNSAELGKLTGQEKFVIAVFLGMLTMWVLADKIGIPILVTALLGVCIFIFFGTLELREILSSQGIFNSILMIGILISYVKALSSFGAIEWFNGVISTFIGGIHSTVAFVMLSTIYFFTHYFFTGEGSRIIALYASFLATGMAIGLDSFTVAMTLAAFSSISGVLTNYSGPVALTMFSSNYVPVKKWFSCGFCMAIITMTVWFLYALPHL